MKTTFVLLVSGLTALPALAAPAQRTRSIYEAVISRAAQPSWTVANGGSWMQEVYRVQVTVETALPVSTSVTDTQRICGYDDDTGKTTLCPVIETVADIGTAVETISLVLPDGTETKVGETQVPLILENDAAPDAPAPALATFSENLSLAAPVSGQRQLELSFGDIGVISLSLQTTVDARGRINSVTGVSLPDRLNANWEVDDGMNVVYEGPITLQRR